jgi:hypothetical protein
MRILLVGMLLSVSALAQSTPTRMAPACGLSGVDFDVKLDKSQHTVVQPQPGKAQVYFVQDIGGASFDFGGKVVSWIGIDGQWLGMNKNNSYFSVSLEPGERHLCVIDQLSSDHSIEILPFKAEAGSVYYFRERVVLSRFGIYLFLDPVNSDEAEYLIGSFPLSISHPKK